MPAMPKPGPEHAVLKDEAGSWDATVESFAAPGQPPMLSKGIETGTMVGGFWLVSDFKSEMMGQPFLGHSTLGFDPAKKKYVSTWIDSMTPVALRRRERLRRGHEDVHGLDGRPRPPRASRRVQDGDGLQGPGHAHLRPCR